MTQLSRFMNLYLWRLCSDYDNLTFFKGKNRIVPPLNIGVGMSLSSTLPSTRLKNHKLQFKIYQRNVKAKYTLEFMFIVYCLSLAI